MSERQNGTKSNYMQQWMEGRAQPNRKQWIYRLLNFMGNPAFNVLAAFAIVIFLWVVYGAFAGAKWALENWL